MQLLSVVEQLQSKHGQLPGCKTSTGMKIARLTLSQEPHDTLDYAPTSLRRGKWLAQSDNLLVNSMID